MQEVDKTNFEREVLAAPVPVLVDFWSPRCEPCLELGAELEELEQRYGDRVKFARVNVTQNRRLALSQRVLGLPVVAIYLGGEKVAQLTGEVDAETVAGHLRKLTGEQHCD